MNEFHLNIILSTVKSRLSVALIVLALAAPLALWAQESLSEPAPPVLEELPPGFMDSTMTDSIPGSNVMKSPLGAVLRSMALPGWGQFYTGHPVRGSLSAVLESTFLAAMVVKYRDRNSMTDRLHALEREHGPEWPVDDPERVLLNENIKDLNRKAGDYLAYGLTTLFLSMIDSYVSAHLYRFDGNFYAGACAGTVALRFEF